MTTLPNTGTVFDPVDQGRTNSGLSTQIIIKVNNQAVGALQEFTVSQSRGLTRIKEVGTDGVVEIVPTDATNYEIRARRVVFDQLRLPESFSRAFRFIGSQRIPFDIEIFDISKAQAALLGTAIANDTSGVVVMTYKNCWFQSYETPYSADNYLITESANIWAEHAFVSNGETINGSPRTVATQTDSVGIEESVNRVGGGRGSLDAAGLVNSIFTE